jgi:hypothetical protein
MSNCHKEKFITVGFPRSGNTYLNYSFRSLYYPESTPYKVFHSASTIDKFDHLFIPFRNPLDSIASWNNYPSNCEIELDIKYYIRFYSHVMNNLNKVTLMNFDYFTKDLEYIKGKVKESINIESIYSVSDKQIKDYMIEDKKNKNLPLSNPDNVSIIKETLVNTEIFKECLVIYDNLLKATSHIH